MKEVMWKCPNCGQNFVNGPFGPYCEGHCGFSLGHPFGKKLKGEQVRDLLLYKEVKLTGLTSKRTGRVYDICIRPLQVEAYSYLNRQGDDKEGYRFVYERTFPEKKEEGGNNKEAKREEA